MANTGNSDKWYFTKEQLENTPSRKCGFDDYKELQYRQQAANFIQDMGQRLKVSQLCINTAIVYMHRFYVFHSFTNFPWHQMAAAALFLAAKVEEQPRKLEYVIRVANICKNPRDSSFDINSERYIAQSQDLVFNENVLLQTLGFDVAIDHPHTYVVRCCHLVRASKDLAQTSYFMASNSLHLTTMCLQYKPTVVACFCILLACKWSNWEIPLSNEKKEWYTYVDPTVTSELLQQLTSEFLVIFENCPSRLKEKIMAKQESSGSPFDQEKKQQDNNSQRNSELKGDDPHKHRSSRPHDAHRSQEQREKEYKERKEKERIAHMSGMSMPHQSHHHRPDRPPVDPKIKLHSRPSNSQPYPSNARPEPRDILREASKDSPFGIPAVRDPNRDHPRGDKEVSKRDPLLKPNVQTDPNSLTNYSHRIDQNRSRTDPSKSASKQDTMRRHEEQKPQVKAETDNIKKHLSSSFDKNSSYLKSSSSTSQKVTSPFNLDNKSVPKINSQSGAAPKNQYNGNTSGSYNKPSSETEVKVKTDPVPVKEEVPTPAFIKRPSLFSPEKTPPQKHLVKSESIIDTSSLNLTAISPINSPASIPSARNRNYSSSSEGELRPTMKKIDQMEGFENLMRDSTIGMANMSNVSDKTPSQEQNVSHQVEVKSEAIGSTKDTSQNTIVNGIENNPVFISNLLKETASNSHLPGVAAAIKPEPVDTSSQSAVAPPPEHKEKEHHHHKSKKKKEKHKHRDKDKNKEEKEKKKKHKDKDREKHKHKEKKEVVEQQPPVSEHIKIKIQRDKIQPLSEGLKIKIPKDKIKTEGIIDPLPQPSTGGLKIKIPKEMFTNCATSSSHSLNSLDNSMNSSSSSRKRERERSSPTDTPPTKYSKSSHRDSKQNGRHSHSKVRQNQPCSSENLENNAPIDSTVSENIDVHKEKSVQNMLASESVQMEEINVAKTPENVDEGSLANPELDRRDHDNNIVEMVSPAPLSPFLSSSTIQDAQLNISSIPLSPISASSSPPVEQTANPKDMGYCSNTSIDNISSSNNNSTISNSSQNNSKELRSTTPDGFPTSNNSVNEQNVKTTNEIKASINNTSSLEADTNSQPHKQSNYYKPVNNNYKWNNTSQFQKNHRNNNYENNEYTRFHHPKYPSKRPRGYNGPPRYPPPGHPSRCPPPAYHIPPPPTPPPQMAYNLYQMVPPMPNMSVPPPTYGMYASYFSGYMYPDVYQQANNFASVNQPPLPTEAPPSDVPPPPPPDS